MGQARRNRMAQEGKVTKPGYTRQAERDAINRVVQEGNIMVVWLSERGMIEWAPTAQGGCALFAVRPSTSETGGASGADIIRRCGNLILTVGLPVLIIQDVTGLGATDMGQEKWGSDDQMTHDGIWNSNDVKKAS